MGTGFYIKETTALNVWSRRKMLVKGINQFAELSNSMERIEHLEHISTESPEFTIDTYTVKVRKNR